MLERRLLSSLAGVMLLAVAVPPARADTVTVVIQTLGFVPAEIHVKKGDTIEWVNKDPIAHTATVKGAWEVTIPPMQTATRTLRDEGAVDYFCRFHPNMTGRIVVTAP
jgi:plastocyanin